MYERYMSFENYSTADFFVLFVVFLNCWCQPRLLRAIRGWMCSFIMFTCLLESKNKDTEDKTIIVPCCFLSLINAAVRLRGCETLVRVHATVLCCCKNYRYQLVNMKIGWYRIDVDCQWIFIVRKWKYLFIIIIPDIDCSYDELDTIVFIKKEKSKKK